MDKKCFFIGCFAVLLLFGCQPSDSGARRAVQSQEPTSPKSSSDLDKIDVLIKLLERESHALADMKGRPIEQLEKDFISCDSSLQFLPEEKWNDAFEKLQLVNAYIMQFKETSPVMEAEMDSTMARLELLRNDVAAHYFPDSLAVAYIEDETRAVEKLSNQVKYFKERLGNCRKDLDDFKIKK